LSMAKFKNNMSSSIAAAQRQGNNGATIVNPNTNMDISGLADGRRGSAQNRPISSGHGY